MFEIADKSKKTTVTITATENVTIVKDVRISKRGKFVARWFDVTKYHDGGDIQVDAKGFGGKQYPVLEATELYEFLVKESGLKE